MLFGSSIFAETDSPPNFILFKNYSVVLTTEFVFQQMGTTVW